MSASVTPPALPHRPWVPFVLLAGMWIIHALLVIPTWGWTYWDFGDGNYMYIARRVREGVVLYKDILAPQPPLHTLAGVVAQALGKGILGSELHGVRVYCLLARWAASLFVMLLALRFFRCPFRAVASAAIYLTLPIGFWWSLGYQSENLEIIFLTAALWLILSWDRRQVALAGALGALACHTNMTGAPFLLANALFLACRTPRLLPWYLAPAAGVYTIIALVANVQTDGAFISNVLLNQAGTFPRTDILASQPGAPDTFLQYAWGKVSSQSAEVLRLEAGFIVAAFLGVLYEITLAPARAGTLADPDARRRWHGIEFMAWQLVAGLLSICFTAKGGTVNYIFVLGEPAVAIWAATALVALLRKSLPRTADDWRFNPMADTRVFLRVLFPLLLLALVYAPAIGNIRLTLAQYQVELPERRALEVRSFIESYTQPGDLILAPPFYAYLTQTVVAGELAENYIWNIKYLNETFDARMYGKPTGEAVEKMEEIAALLRERRVKVVLLDTAQTGNVPEIRAALEENYQAAEEGLLRTRNTRLQLLVPRDTKLRHAPMDHSRDFFE